VTAGDARCCSFVLDARFTGTQINTLYNGIKVGPSEMTVASWILQPRPCRDSERAASLLSGEGAIGGAVNYVTKAPIPARSPTRLQSFDSFKDTRRLRFGRQHSH